MQPSMDRGMRPSGVDKEKRGTGTRARSQREEAQRGLQGGPTRRTNDQSASEVPVQYLLKDAAAGLAA